MKRVLFCLSVLLTIMATSCDKEPETEDTPALTKENIAGKYILTGATMQVGTTERDVTEYFIMEDCERDNIIEFKTDMTFEVTEGAMQCSDPTHEEGDWALPGNNILTMDGEDGQVKKWDGKDLYFSRPDEVDGQDVTVLFKLRKQ